MTKVSTRPEVGEDAGIDRVAGIVDDYRNFRRPLISASQSLVRLRREPAVRQGSESAMQLHTNRPIWALAVAAVALAAPVATPQETLQDASEALQSGDPARAVRIATALIEGDDSAGNARWVRGNALEELGEYASAAEDYQQLARQQPSEPRLFLALGSASFKSGDIAGSIEAFDSASELEPSLGPQLWQRGIAHYYAKRYADGVRQFETHRTVNPEDVENSVWHFLCAAAIDGPDQAREGLIPVTRDGRIPMKEILDLYRGDASPGTVLEVAERARDDGRGGAPMFYAHLYLGLYYEAMGDSRQSKEHIDKAVAFDLPRNYMWQVARIHQRLRSESN